MHVLSAKVFVESEGSIYITKNVRNRKEKAFVFLVAVGSSPERLKWQTMEQQLCKLFLENESESKEQRRHPLCSLGMSLADQ